MRAFSLLILLAACVPEVPEPPPPRPALPDCGSPDAGPGTALINGLLQRDSSSLTATLAESRGNVLVTLCGGQFELALPENPDVDAITVRGPAEGERAVVMAPPGRGLLAVLSANRQVVVTFEHVDLLEPVSYAGSNELIRLEDVTVIGTEERAFEVGFSGARVELDDVRVEGPGILTLDARQVRATDLDVRHSELRIVPGRGDWALERATVASSTVKLGGEGTWLGGTVLDCDVTLQPEESIAFQDVSLEALRSLEVSVPRDSDGGAVSGLHVDDARGPVLLAGWPWASLTLEEARITGSTASATLAGRVAWIGGEVTDNPDLDVFVDGRVLLQDMRTAQNGGPVYTVTAPGAALDLLRADFGRSTDQNVGGDVMNNSGVHDLMGEVSGACTPETCP